MSDFTNNQLFNCCQSESAPNWADFDYLILGGAATHVMNPEAEPKDQETQTEGD